MKITFLIIVFSSYLLQGNSQKVTQLDSVAHELNIHQIAIDSLTKKLISIVLDKNESEPILKKAIDLLVKINTKESLQFLIQNIAKIYFPSSFMTADSEFDSYYIFISLSKKSADNWYLIPIIIHSLNSTKSDTEITLITFLLLQILVEENLVSEMLETQLSETSDIMKHNLIRIAQSF